MTQSIVVLTGAGISAESGIKTFRASDGLWEEHAIEDVASPEGFARDPALVQRFYNQRRQQLLSDEVKANPAHFALAELEKKFDGDFLLVTQNIDDLHERGGSENIIHMHGELLKSHCSYSQKVFEQREDLAVDNVCACCSKKGRLRPHIVWFGEMPLKMNAITVAIQKCDLFLSIGTSGNVYPAAGFVKEADYFGAHTVEINLEPTMQQSQFKEQIYGKAGEVLPEFVKSFKF
jgi:NAD-dependent deacetylase